MERNVINWNKIRQEIKKITVNNVEGEDVIVTNGSSLEMIGKGRQGAVFKINDEVCLKVYGDPDDCEREYYALSLGQNTSLLPKVYYKGKNFIAMEMIRGLDLREYLQTNPLTKELSYRLIQMLLTFKKIGYERIDHHKRQIYLQEDGSLKVIDVGRTVWRNRTYPYPRKLLQSLGNDYAAIFLEHVKEIAPKLYEEWEYYMYMEEVAKQLYRNLQEKTDIDWELLGMQTDKLLTTEDRKMHYNQLLNLVRKVVKEEEKRKMAKEEKTKYVKEEKGHVKKEKEHVKSVRNRRRVRRVGRVGRRER